MTSTQHTRTARTVVLAFVVALLAVFAVQTSVGAAPALAASAPKGTIAISASAKAVSSGRAKTSVKVTLKAKKTTGTRYVDATMYPYTGAAKWQRIKVKWSAKKKAYVGSKTWTGATTGKLIAKALGAKDKVVTVKRPATKITGWDAKVTVASGKPTTDTVKVTPAYGRKVYLQKATGHGWANVTAYTTSKAKQTASVKITISAAQIKTATKWRVTTTGGAAAAKSTSAKAITVKKAATATSSTTVVPSVVGKTKAAAQSAITAAGLKATFVTVTTSAHAAGTVTATSPAAGAKAAKGATVKVTIAAAPSSTTPPTDPGDPGTGTPIPGCGTDMVGEPIPCSTPSVSTVLDRWTVNPACGVTMTCRRTATAAEADAFGITPARKGDTFDPEDFVFDWSPATTPSATGWTTLGMPDFLAQLNAFRASNGKAALKAMPTSVTVGGYTVAGQGGFAQNWAAHTALASANHTFGLVASRDHSCIQRSDIESCYVANGSGLTKWFTAWGASSDANADVWWNQNYPDAGGRFWDCRSENIGAVAGAANGGSMSTSSSVMIAAWQQDSTHRNTMLADKSYASFGATTGRDGTQYYVLNVCQLVDVNPVMVDQYGTSLVVNPTVSTNQAWAPAS